MSDVDELLAAAAELPSDASLESVKDIVLRYIRLEAAREEHERNLADLNQKIHDLRTREIPERLNALGMTGVPLRNGFKLEVAPFVTAGIKLEKKDVAYAWLEEIGEGDLIKNDVVATFARGEDQQAGIVASTLREQGYTVSQKRTVHAQTLLAFIRRRIEAGEPVNKDVIDVWAGQKATIKMPKEMTFEMLLEQMSPSGATS